MSARVRIESAISGGNIEIAFYVNGRPRVAEPDASFPAIGIDVEHGLLRQGLGVIAHDPTVIGIYVTRGSPQNINGVIGQGKRSPRVFFQRIEGNIAIDHARALSGN